MKKILYYFTPVMLVLFGFLFDWDREGLSFTLYGISLGVYAITLYERLKKEK